MQILFGLRWLATVTGLSVVLVIQLFLIVAETALIAATDRLMARLGTPRRRFLLLAGFALNPVCVLLTVQHGNFDCLVALAIVLCLERLARFLEDGDAGSWLLSAFFLGLAIALKMAPAVLIPLLAAGARRLSRTIRVTGGLLFAGPALYGLSILFALTPGAVARNILGYRSISGWFGVTGVLHFLRLDSAVPWYGLLFAAAILTGATLAGAVLWGRENVTFREPILLALLLLIAIPFLGGGYGPQYFFWFWPLLLAAAPADSDRIQRAAAVFAGAAAATYVVEYALMDVLGSFLLWKSDAPWLSLAALVLRSNRAAALLQRAPLRRLRPSLWSGPPGSSGDVEALPTRESLRPAANYFRLFLASFSASSRFHFSWRSFRIASRRWESSASSPEARGR